ncbi:MAG: hypothetical protein V4858_15510 [Pseudomonadota bacterium]
MIWKLLGMQKKLDALFDGGWVRLGLPSERGGEAEVLLGDALVTPAQA